MLPERVRRAVEDVGGGTRTLVNVTPVAGGCITPVARITFDDASHAFLKWGDVAGGFFAAEAHSLNALARANAVRVPDVLGVGEDWLLLEWLEPGRARATTWSSLGRQLAALHRNTGPAFGWDRDNWIGSLPQRNRRHDVWATFWREERIAPQWRSARANGYFDTSDDLRMQRLFDSFDTLLSAGGQDGPSLLHGDLWNGNAHVMADGAAALIDPSCAWGDREVDLAMASLFGGFGPDFFESYSAAWPLKAGWQQRRHAYQLYYLLVHVNLFGASYTSGTRQAMRAALGE